MNWFYESGGKQNGPISEAELESLIRAGTITPRTLVWREGMADWQPLSDARPNLDPNLETCAACGQLFPKGDLIQIAGRPICSNCKPAVLQDLEQGGSLERLTDAARTGPAWEQLEQIGIAAAVWQTVQEVLTRPAETFSTMKREGGLLAPLSYALLVGTVGYAVNAIYQVAMRSVMNTQQQMPPGLPPELVHYMELVQKPSFYLILAILSPFLIVFITFFQSAITHLCLMLCGGANRGFETTFRVVAYTIGSTASLELIPICGSMVAGIWRLICYCIGLAKAHETDTWRAVVAVLMPFIVCCVGSVGLIAAAVAKTAGSR
jgi:hypothetical protein